MSFDKAIDNTELSSPPLAPAMSSFLSNDEPSLEISLLGVPHGMLEVVQEFKCSLCTETFNSFEGLFYHDAEAHQLLTTYICKKCGDCFKSRELCIAHIMGCDSVNKDQAAARPSKRGKRARQRPVRLSSADIHKLLPKIPVPVEIGPDKRYEDYVRERSKNEENHKKSRKFECTLCQMSFTTNMAVINHLKRKHVYSSLFPCEVCKKVFYVMADLTVHVAKAHDRNNNTKVQNNQNLHEN